MNNADRASDAVNHYWEQREGTPLPLEEVQDTITDLLADLRLLCQREGLDFEAGIRMSELHFNHEQ
jgi:hypothetical protein